MKKISVAALNEIINCFKISGIVEGVLPFGNGHINNTYIVHTSADGKTQKYVLQQINTGIFKNPDELMANIWNVTSFLNEKTGNHSESLTFIETINGDKCFINRNGDAWRMYEYIDFADGVDMPNDEEFHESALAFGRFQSLLSDFPADTLYETIPDFHNTPKRYDTFLKSVEQNKSGRLNNALAEVEFIKKRKDFYPTLINANKKGLLPLRASHNDTKSNNVLLDNKTHKAVCVIDLDTIMPGFSVTDFGDAIRFGANTGAEDEKDLTKVNFDIEKFRIFAKGFIKGCNGQLPKDEIMLLPEGAKMMTIECGIRFLTDYLDGDTYFKTAYPEHNLVRCRTQLKLVEDMEKSWDEMKAIVKEYI